MRCILTNKTIGITLFSIGTNDSYHWCQATRENNLSPLNEMHINQ